FRLRTRPGCAGWRKDCRPGDGRARQESGYRRGDVSRSASWIRCQVPGSRSQVSGFPTTWHLSPALRLLWHNETFAVDLVENNIATSTKKGFANFFAQAHRIITLAGFAQNFFSIGMGHERAQANAAFLYFGERSDGNLATAAEFAEQGTLTGGGGAGGAIIEKRQQRPSRHIAVTNFDCQGALSSGGGHYFDRNHL